MKKSIIVSCIVIALLIVLCSYKNLLTIIEKDSCLDTSICKQGIEVNTEYGFVEINYENCLKYGWKWREETKSCDMS